MIKVSMIILLLVGMMEAKSQSVSINTDNSNPDPSAILDVKSTVKGFLLPRMTTVQRIAISNPAIGLKVFDTTTKSFWFFNGSTWIESATGSATNYWSKVGNHIYNNNSGNVGIGTTTPDSKLSIYNNVVAYSGNTYMISLMGRNPLIDFRDENNVSYGYIKTWTYNASAPFTNGMLIGSSPGYPIFLSTNYGVSMMIANNGNVGIGTATPDSKLSIYSGTVASNDNTYMISLRGRNPLIDFRDENNIAYGYIKSWTHSPYAPFTNGMLIGSTPGNPIFLSTNYALSMIIANNGNVGIGTANPTYKLAVNGNIRCKELVVESNWADYVFDEKYRALPLDSLELYIQKYNHLPNIPSAKEIQEKGLNVGKIQQKMMEKIEEMALYILDLKREIELLKSAPNKQ